MIDTLLRESEELPISAHTPHLSYSRINRYLHCPEQYQLYYIENLRPKIPPASLVFGQVLHQALAHFFGKQGGLLESFQMNWNDVGQIDLDYNQRESWEKLQACGNALLERFLREGLPRLGPIWSSEKVFELRITNLDLPFVGVIDLIADLDGKTTVVDFKTSSSAYEDHEVLLSDQLTAYQLAEPDADQLALCVFVKTKEPKIEWHKAKRTGEQLIDFLAKAELVAQEINANRFYKRSGKWCSWCDFLPVCTGDTQKVKDTLVSCSVPASNPRLS